MEAHEAVLKAIGKKLTGKCGREGGRRPGRPLPGLMPHISGSRGGELAGGGEAGVAEEETGGGEQEEEDAVMEMGSPGRAGMGARGKKEGDDPSGGQGSSHGEEDSGHAAGVEAGEGGAGGAEGEDGKVDEIEAVFGFREADHGGPGDDEAGGEGKGGGEFVGPEVSIAGDEGVGEACEEEEDVEEEEGLGRPVPAVDEAGGDEGKQEEGEGGEGDEAEGVCHGESSQRAGVVSEEGVVCVCGVTGRMPSGQGFTGDDEPADEVGEQAGAGEQEGGEPSEADDGDIDCEVLGEAIADAGDPVVLEGTEEFFAGAGSGAVKGGSTAGAEVEIGFEGLTALSAEHKQGYAI